MSFSFDVKRELCKFESASECCKYSELYGLLTMGKAFSSDAVVISSENSYVIHRVSILLSELFSVIVDVSAPLKFRSSKVQYVLSIPDEYDRQKVTQYYSGTLSLPTSECCITSFLRGAFLACGSVSNPQNEYHLEFSVEQADCANMLLFQCRQLDINPNVIDRKGQLIVYLKDSQKINDFFGHIGAMDAYWKVFDVIVEKEIRNNVNRRINCDTANITKTVNASSVQISAIKKIINSGELDNLSEQLRELAILRLENPEMSLRELGENLSDNISRSGVNHRLKKLIEISENI